jgi:CRISPR-associated protein Cmr1
MSRTYDFGARTDLWTGDLQGKSDRLITTGLLGSIRWWFEILVRGLGGMPCDPSDPECTVEKRCVVCEFFGCTGWARKFRFDVLKENNEIQQDQIKMGANFKLRFTSLRGIYEEEWALLDLTVRLIAHYGVIGGKTVFKPTDEALRQGKPHHQDFGIITYVGCDCDPHIARPHERDLKAYASRWHKAPSDGREWASLTHFWFVGGRYLTRESPKQSTFNAFVKREESKQQSTQMTQTASSADLWLAGREGVSKKVFSFRDPARTFGFANPSSGSYQITLEEIKQRLGKAWQRTIVETEVVAGDPKKIQLLTGSQILKRLLATGP